MKDTLYSRRKCLSAAAVLAVSAILPLSDAAMAQRGISSGQAANIARQATGGKVLSVSPAGQAYRVRILKPNGDVTTVMVDRKSGRLL